MRAFEEVLQDALLLSRQERLRLAEELHASVMIFASRDIEEAWIREADRRMKRLESGEDPGLTPEEFWSDDEP